MFCLPFSLCQGLCSARCSEAHQPHTCAQEHYETAIYHFQQLLERVPNHYRALSQLVSLLRRAGRLEDIPKFIKAAQRASPRASMDPGLHYCKGLEARSGAASAALSSMGSCCAEWMLLMLNGTLNLSPPPPPISSFDNPMPCLLQVRK